MLIGHLLSLLLLCDYFKESIGQFLTCDASSPCTSDVYSDGVKFVEIYCFGDQNCAYNNLTATGDDLNCLGYFSCESDSSHSTTLTAYDDIFCESQGSCSYGTMEVYNDANSGTNTVYCRAYRACRHAVIIDSSWNIVYCQGLYSCLDATIANIPYVS